MGRRKLNRERLRLHHSRILDAVERPLFGGMRRWFREQERDVLQKVRRGLVGGKLRDGTTTEDLTFVVADEVEKFGKRTVRYMTMAVEMGADSFFQAYGLKPRKKGSDGNGGIVRRAPEVNVAAAFDMADPGVTDFIRETSFDFWEEVHENTKRDLIFQLRVGMQANETTEQITGRVQDVFHGTIRGTAPRARLITRTEVNGAVNGGRWQAALQSEVIDRKQWLSAQDFSVRTTPAFGGTSEYNHRVHEIVKVDEVFLKTGQAMRFPSDPRGSVANRANCRCLAVMLAYDVDDVELPEGFDVDAEPEPEINDVFDAIEATRRQWEEFMFDNRDRRRRKQQLDQIMREEEFGKLPKDEADRLVLERGKLMEEIEQKWNERFIKSKSTRAKLMGTEKQAFEWDWTDRDFADRIAKQYPEYHYTPISKEEGGNYKQVRRDIMGEMDKIAKRADGAFWERMDKKKVKFGYPSSGRAFQASNWENSLHHVVVTDDASDTWHEFGHVIEKDDEAIRDAAIAFWEKRTEGDEWEYLADLFPNSGYGPDERVKRDRWFEIYWGKGYDGQVTELVSGGLEYMRTDRHTAHFWDKDPEHFYFMMAILERRIPGMRGRARKGAR